MKSLKAEVYMRHLYHLESLIMDPYENLNAVQVYFQDGVEEALEWDVPSWSMYMRVRRILENEIAL